MSTIAQLRPAGAREWSHLSLVTLHCSTPERAVLGRYESSSIQRTLWINPLFTHQHSFFFSLYQVHNFMLGLNLNTNTPFSPITEVTYHNPPPEEEVDAVTGTRESFFWKREHHSIWVEVPINSNYSEMKFAKLMILLLFTLLPLVVKGVSFI